MNIEGTFLEKGSIQTPREKLADLIKLIQSIYCKYEGVKGIGISMPGVIDMKEGFAYTGGSLSYIQECPFASLIQEACNGVPVTIGNDAKCAGYAEIGFGVLKDVEDAIILVFGTGLGGCIVKNREVHQGKNFSAGEVSAVKINTSESNNTNNWWGVNSGARGLLRKVQKSIGTNQKYTGKEIFAMANAKNPLVLEALDHFCHDIAVQILNLQAIFDPEKIAIGGGISEQEIFIQAIQENINKIYTANKGYPIPLPKVVACKYRNDANLLGAFYQHLQLNRNRLD
ncbi:hypothetical protein BAU15_06415 [Enterococcus sp. JM4C]|nr:hypothetical protein BAU15_06415 [Enterococcus sp. JM4C]